MVDSESRSGCTINWASLKARACGFHPHLSHRTPLQNTPRANDPVRPMIGQFWCCLYQLLYHAQQVETAPKQSYHKHEGESLLIRCTMRQQKMQNDKLKQQQPACWYNNVCSWFVVDATLNINIRVTVETVATSKQAELRLLISLHLLIILHMWQARRLSCRAVQQPSYAS